MTGRLAYSVGKLSNLFQGISPDTGSDAIKTSMLLARTLQRLATISPGLVMLVLPPAVFASQVRVEVEGDVDNLQDNAQIFVGEVEGVPMACAVMPTPRLPRWRPGRWAITIGYAGR